jgi:hypothetical protein
MKIKFAMLCAIILLLAVIACLLLVIRIITPEEWPVEAGTLKVETVDINGQAFVKVEGEPINFLGQIQSINIGFNDSSNVLMVARCKIRWSPFSSVTVNNQWPVFYPLAGLKPGKYTVNYKSAKGEATAGSFYVK